jgi:glycosyl transferase family 25
MTIDKVYVITLDHSEENKISILKRLDKLTLPNQTTYHIINGVNGKEELSTPELREKFGVTFYDGWSTGSDVIDNGFYNRNVTVGEAGGMCSHIRVWEDAFENNHENVLVLEDDFDPIIPFNWESFNELDGYDWDISFLSRVLVPNTPHAFDSNIGLTNWVNPGYSYNTHAYVITRGGLTKLIETNLNTLKNNIVVSDEFLPATYSYHPRLDMRTMFKRNMNAIAHKGNSVGQLRFESAGNSLTSPIEGIDY